MWQHHSRRSISHLVVRVLLWTFFYSKVGRNSFWGGIHFELNQHNLVMEMIHMHRSMYLLFFEFPSHLYAKSLQSCPTLCDPTDGSPPHSTISGILQARILAWVAISFSNAWKWKVKVKLLSHVRLFAIPWTAAYQPPLSMGFARQENWSGLPLGSTKADHTYIIWSAISELGIYPTKMHTWIPKYRVSISTAALLTELRTRRHSKDNQR